MFNSLPTAKEHSNCSKLFQDNIQMFRAVLPKRKFSTANHKMTSFGIISRTESTVPRVLSLNSHCVHGYVGNKSAAFPLQCMGFDVSTINTTTLSNRPGYLGGFTGKPMMQPELMELIKGLQRNSLLNFDVIISGYLTSPDMLEGLADSIDAVRAVAPNVLVVCDPVLGDNGRYYVPEKLLSFYQRHIIPRCNLVAPNAFEATALTGLVIKNIESAREVCRRFHAMGADYCLLKGVRLNGEDGTLSMVLSYKANREVYCIDFPRIDGDFYGCGDLCTAIAAGWLHQHRDNLALVLEKVSGTMNAIVTLASTRISHELPVIECKDKFCCPPEPISAAYPVHGNLSGVIFDMDGTLTEPGAINFDAMYDRIGLKRKKDVDILTLIAQELPHHEHHDAHAIIIDEELKGCDVMQLRPDLGKMLEYLSENNIRAAISTRNCGDAYLRFREMAGFREETFEPVLSRESLNGINKPDPQVARHILEAWSLHDRPDEVWFVGDSMDDMMCGKRAGCRTCLVTLSGDLSSCSAEEAEYVDISVASLSDFLDHLRFHEIINGK